MQLFYRRYGQTHQPTLVILHGLFGSSDNWHSLARAWSKQFHVIAMDLRNHGQSPHTDTMDYVSMAKDVYETLQNNHVRCCVLLGHSMGGKVAMTFTQYFPEQCTGLMVLDIAPRRYEPLHQWVFEALKAVPVKAIKDRKEADAIMAKFIPQIAIRQFLLKNLKRTKEGTFQWRFNLDAIIKNYHAIVDVVPFVQPWHGPTLFIRGELSPYIQEKDKAQILTYFPKAQIKTYPKAGHWIHVDARETLLKEVEIFFHELIQETSRC